MGYEGDVGGKETSGRKIYVLLSTIELFKVLSLTRT
jgi:hypothetical protein